MESDICAPHLCSVDCSGDFGEANKLSPIEGRIGRDGAALDGAAQSPDMNAKGFGGFLNGEHGLDAAEILARHGGDVRYKFRHF